MVKWVGQVPSPFIDVSKLSRTEIDHKPTASTNSERQSGDMSFHFISFMMNVQSKSAIELYT